jgi:1-phosphofructokinase
MKQKIYTITLAPAFDYVLKFNSFEKNKTNRPFSRDLYAAGKGVHVSMMLNNFQQKSEAIIFTSGNLKSYFLKDLTKNKVNFKNFNSVEEIRINLKLLDVDQTESSVLSPKIEFEEISHLKKYLKKKLKKDDLVIIAGSSPKNLGEKIYFEIGKIVQQKAAYLIVDAFGPLLSNTFKAQPFLIKPNLEELELTSQKKLTSLEEIIAVGKEILNQGVKNILLSLGKDGAMLMNREKTYLCSIPKTN